MQPERTVIGLRGSGNSGKTETICKVYRDFTNRKGVRAIFRGFANYKLDGALAKFYGEQEGEDYKEVYAAVLEIDGVLVGFASQGDHVKFLRPLLAKLKQLHCMVIVCATRTNANKCKTVQLVMDLEREGFDVKFIDKTKGRDPAKFAEENRIMAKTISEEVLEAVGKFTPVEV